MKKPISTIIIAAFITLGVFGRTNAQSTDKSIHAFFKGTEAEVKNDIKSNSLSFTISGVDTDQQAADFLKRSKPYAKSFTMTIADPVNGQRECKINFIGTPDLKWMLRFFLASSVKDVEQNNVKKNVNDFFKPYM